MSRLPLRPISSSRLRSRVEYLARAEIEYKEGLQGTQFVIKNPNMAAAERATRKSLLWLVAVGFFMHMLDATIVSTAYPSMASSLVERPLRMHSVIVAYALTMAMLIPASGWLIDRFGARRVFFSAIVLFVAGSVACAASHSLGQLVASRVLQ